MKKIVATVLLILIVVFILFFNGSSFNRRVTISYLPKRLLAMLYLLKHFTYHEKKQNLTDIVRDVSEKYNVSADLINSIIAVESGFRRYAISPRGAMGLVQLMPVTVDEMKVKDPFSAEQNVSAGIKYFKHLYDRYGDVARALAAYNSGPKNVDKFHDVPPFKETRLYVKKVLDNLKKYKGKEQ